MALSNYVITNKWYRQAIEEGLAKGLAKGRDEGLARGEREALRAVLQARALVVSTEQSARIDACSDPDALRAWIVRAATATHIDAVFE